jgi:hypothetical protein
MSSDLPAGRALDAVVAEGVMGLKLGPAPMSGSFKITCVRVGDREWRSLPYYSTDIAAAWPVLEKLRENQNIDIHEYSEGWEVVLIGPGSHAVTGQADTASHAICLAALRAVGQ